MKRYASYALRLQQELAREKLKRHENQDDEILDEEDARFPDLNEKYTGPSGTFVWDKKVEKATKEHVAWARKIDRVAHMLDERRGEAVRSKEKDARRDNQMEQSIENVMQSLVPFLQHQRRLIGELGRENTKLRDMFHARPTRRELLVS